jgi:hypothetical protein
MRKTKDLIVRRAAAHQGHKPRREPGKSSRRS